MVSASNPSRLCPLKTYRPDSGSLQAPSANLVLRTDAFDLLGGVLD